MKPAILWLGVALTGCSGFRLVVEDGGPNDGSASVEDADMVDAGMVDAADGSTVDGDITDAATDMAVAADMLIVPPSCVGLPATCGPGQDGSCCESPLVTGGTFYRSYDGVDGGPYLDKSYPATVSDFRLDEYEVTVGRFRQFVAEYPGNLPPEGAGKNPHNASDPGWDFAWNTNVMPATQADLILDLNCGAANHTYQTWTDDPPDGGVGHENLPIDCITWFEAFAFCIWDGGRLPTEAEWNYAAAGGSEQREYPWGSADPGDGGYAVYMTSVPAHVGSDSPTGDGLYGQADLAGNEAEWVLDWYDSPYQTPSPCSNCAELIQSDSRVVRGGECEVSKEEIRVAKRAWGSPAQGDAGLTVRCARSP